MTKFDDAKKRADRLGNFFPASGDSKTMDDIIAALEKEEQHLMNPTVNIDSGKAEFFAACLKALPTGGMTNAEKAAFVADLWAATWASRKAQEYKPCW